MTGLVEGKVALVTGAGSGIGRASAELFAREGARVVVADIEYEAAETTVARITKAGGTAVAVRVDVGDEPQVEAMIRTTLDTYGRLDAAHNNAGISVPPEPFHETDTTRWHRQIRVNMTGVFLCMKHELAVMVEQGSGAIVNTASGSGIIGFPGLAAYTAAKHGVIGLTKTAAVEYAARRIRVNSVCPGVIDTPMMQRFIGGDAEIEASMKGTSLIGEFGKPQDIAEAAVWLCSDRASFVSGESMLVDYATVAR